MDVLGIDFGTSNTVAVLAGDGRPPRVLAIDGVGWLPSSIYIDDDGTLSVGRDAERKARLAPERFEANPKRRIDDSEILLGVRVVPVVEAIAAVLRRVIDEARRQLNGRSPDQVNLTHPAEWGAARQNILLAAARSAGLGPAVALIPEPVAAAAHFSSLPGKALTPGASLAVYDLGGGTFDCAVVGSTANGFTVLAESGLANVGGVDFDQAVVDHLGRTVSAEDPAKWQGLSRPRNSADRRAARSLREDVQAAKETLSRYAQTDLPLPDPFDDTLLTRKEFEGLIRPVLARTVEVLATTISRAGLTADRLGGIYLVGGSSRIPLVAGMIAEKLGVMPTTLDQPETAVAMGAALIPVMSRQGRTEMLGGTGVGPGGIGPGSTGSGGIGAVRPGPGPAGPGQVGPGPAGPVRPGMNPGTGRPFNGPGVYGPAGQQYQSGPQAPVAQGASATGSRTKRNRMILIAVAVVAVLAIGTGIAVATRSNSSADNPPATSASSPSTSSTSSHAPSSSRPTPTTPTTHSTASGPAKTSTSRTSTSRTSTSPSGTRSSIDPAKCSSATTATGVTGCMSAVIGTLADLSCSQDPDVLSLDASTVAEIQTLTTSWSACIDSDKNYAAVIFQTTGAPGRETMWPFVLQQFKASRSGTWKAGADSGVYSAGLSPSGIALVGWKDANLPVLAFIGATNDAGVDKVIDYWKTALGATITG